jgi:hypothetical protein
MLFAQVETVDLEVYLAVPGLELVSGKSIVKFRNGYYFGVAPKCNFFVARGIAVDFDPPFRCDYDPWSVGRSMALWKMNLKILDGNQFPDP